MTFLADLSELREVCVGDERDWILSAFEYALRCARGEAEGPELKVNGELPSIETMNALFAAGKLKEVCAAYEQLLDRIFAARAVYFTARRNGP